MMVYIAERKIKNVDRNDKVTVYNPGDEIKDFGTWNIHAQRAHLNMQWVTTREKPVEVQAEPKKKPKKKPKPPKPEGEEPAPEQPLEFAESEELWACGQCDKKEFKSSKALKIHLKKAHP
jgi:hypothetical protein